MCVLRLTIVMGLPRESSDVASRGLTLDGVLVDGGKMLTIRDHIVGGNVE